jgi:hypothetical protein
LAADAAVTPQASTTAEQWGVYELALKGPADGNPFVDVASSRSELTTDITARRRVAEGIHFTKGNGGNKETPASRTPIRSSFPSLSSVQNPNLNH